MNKKISEPAFPVSRILALTPERPLFWHKSGKQQKTHWIAFMKTQDEIKELAKQAGCGKLVEVKEKP